MSWAFAEFCIHLQHGFNRYDDELHGNGITVTGERGGQLM